MSDVVQRLMGARTGEYLVPDAPEYGRCRSCGAEIIWIETVSGAKCPLSVASIEQDGDGRRYALTHFADCPNAARHRKAVR